MGWFDKSPAEQRRAEARRELDRNNERERAAKIRHQTQENEQAQRRLRQAEKEARVAKAAAKNNKSSGWW